MSAALAYTGLCFFVDTVPIAGSLWWLPVALAGWLLGQRAGVGMGVYVVLVLGLAFRLHSAPAGHTFPGLMFSAWVSIACGSAVGRLHDLALRLRERLEKRRQAQDELRQAEEQSRALLEALPDTIYRIDRAGTVLSYQVPRGSTQTPEREAEGARNLSDMLPREVVAEAIECINEALETGEVVTFEYREGEGASARDAEARLVKAGEHEVIALVRDVTALRHLQHELDDAHRRALHAAGTKGRFLATMSHQIRTPMNGVIGMTNVLLQTKLTPEQREYTSIIRNSGEALLSIVDDVLDYTKIETGKMELGRAPFPLRTLLEEIVELLSVRAHDKGLEIASMIDARVPDRVVGDRGRLRQVITNLLGNAVRFTQRGHVVVRMTVVGHDRDTAFIRFDVSDTGMGIPREQQKNLFQEFAQANTAIAREFGGTGLGLAISRQIVELMGGRMLVESAPGEGSTFSFTARFGTATEHTTGNFLLPRSLSGARILALAPHPLTREVLEHELAPFGAKLAVALDLRDAERKLREPGAVDLLVLELPLGSRDADAQSWVREVAQIARNVPIAVLCGMGHRSVSDAAREAGAAITLSRPLRRAALYEGFGHVLGVNTRRGGRPKASQNGTRPSAAGGKLRARVLVAEDNLINQKVAVRNLEMLGCEAEVAA
ncbi:MAG: ATP-binding protein, partial [Polyangiales bacterium]